MVLNHFDCYIVKKYKTFRWINSKVNSLPWKRVWSSFLKCTVRILIKTRYSTWRLRGNVSFPVDGKRERLNRWPLIHKFISFTISSKELNWNIFWRTLEGGEAGVIIAVEWSTISFPQHIIDRDKKKLDKRNYFVPSFSEHEAATASMSLSESEVVVSYDNLETIYFMKKKRAWHVQP